MPFSSYIFDLQVVNFDYPEVGVLFDETTFSEKAKTSHLLVSFKREACDTLGMVELMSETIDQIHNKICRFIFHKWFDNDYYDYEHPTNNVQKELIIKIKSAVSVEASPEYKLQVNIYVAKLLDNKINNECLRDIMTRLEYFILGELSTMRVICKISD